MSEDRNVHIAVHGHNSTTVIANYQKDKDIIFQKGTSFIHADRRKTATNQETTVEETWAHDLRKEHALEISNKVLEIRQKNQMRKRAPTQTGVPVHVRTAIIQFIFKMAVPEFTAWMLTKVPTNLRGKGRKGEPTKDWVPNIWDRALLILILKQTDLFNLIAENLSPHVNDLEDLCHRVRNSLYWFERNRGCNLL